MTEIFIRTVNMSITASTIIIAVFLLRLLMKRAPGYCSYALWLIVFVRFLCPFSLEADWGIIPGAEVSGFWEKGDLTSVGDSLYPTGRNSAAAVVSENDMKNQPYIETEGIQKTESEVSAQGMENTESARSALTGGKGILQGAAGVWLMGCAGLLLYSMISYLQLMKSLKVCKKEAERKKTKEEARDEKYSVIISKEVKGPFVAGFFRPVIYLPHCLWREQRESQN